MGVAIWTLNFVVIFTLDNSGMAAYNFSTIIFSLALAIALAGVGLLAISYKTQVLQIVFLRFHVYDGHIIQLYNGNIFIKPLFAL